jgi:hypothetical protein
MDESTKGLNGARDTAAECHTRAAADRVRADKMDTQNGRRKFEESAANWDVRGELLGRLEASFDKRERLDAAANQFAADQRAEADPADTGLEASDDEVPERRV